MRRKDREQTDPAAMEAIIRRCTVCRLGMVDGDQPYVIPISFGYRDRVVYLHCAHEGRKIDVLKQHPKVCIEWDIDTVLVPAAEAHQYTQKFRSVIAFGTASFVTEPNAKRRALDVLMAQYAEGSFAYPDNQVDRTCIIRIDISKMTGKQSGWGQE
ncbi:MAG: pyridoxamine 5'-phosphate oxidase family protein [bacterium]